MDYDRLRVVAALAHSFGLQTVMGIGSASDAFGDPLPFWERFQLGGFLRLSGTPRAAFDGEESLFGAFVTHRRIIESPLGSVYAGLSLEAGRVRNEASPPGPSEDWIYAGSLFAAVDTILGPIYLAYGYTEGGERAAYLILGRFF
jgi:NTE family protein